MQDELDKFLKERYPNNYWSGERDCNLLIWGAEGTVPKLCSLNYGIEYDPFTGKVDGKTISDILNEEYKTKQAFKRLISYGKSLSQKCGIPFAVIVYPALRRQYEDRWEDTEEIFARDRVAFYWYKLSGSAGECISGEILKTRIYSLFGKNYTDAGTTKQENSHLSDYFHYWSRMSLSKSITKLDVDGIIVNDSGDKGILIEIKRSSRPPIPQWTPYLSDRSNYALEAKYSRAVEAYFWLLHHESRQCHDKEVISFYDISGVDEEKEEDFLLTKDTILEYSLTGADSLDVRIEQFIRR